MSTVLGRQSPTSGWPCCAGYRTTLAAARNDARHRATLFAIARIARTRDWFRRLGLRRTLSARPNDRHCIYSRFPTSEGKRATEMTAVHRPPETVSWRRYVAFDEHRLSACLAHRCRSFFGATFIAEIVDAD